MAKPSANKYKIAPDSQISATQAKQTIAELVTKGYSIADAVRATGKSIKSYEYYRMSDAQFKEAIDLARAVARREGAISEEDANISFEDFRAKYLNSKTFNHQRNIISMLEEGKPAWLHPNMKYEEGFPNYVLVNMPPEHAKSMTVSIDYITYRICIDPNIRIKIV